MKATCLAILGILAAIPAFAHHTVAYTFDITKLVALTGTVTRIEWKNPHAIYHLAVIDASDVTVNWDIESRHLEGLRHDGIQWDTIKVGDRITMKMMLAQDGSHRASTASVVLPDGRSVKICTVTYNACPPE